MATVFEKLTYCKISGFVIDDQVYLYLMNKIGPSEFSALLSEVMDIFHNGFFNKHVLYEELPDFNTHITDHVYRNIDLSHDEEKKDLMTLEYDIIDVDLMKIFREGA